MKTPTVASLKKKLDILWSKQIRERDRICQKCGKAKASQAAHIISRGNLSTRWNPKNGIGMCYYCHIIWAHRKPLEFVDWLETKFGRMAMMKLREESRKTEPWGVKKLQAKLQEIKTIP